jgi:hypothetical protein
LNHATPAPGEFRARRRFAVQPHRNGNVTRSISFPNVKAAQRFATPFIRYEAAVYVPLALAGSARQGPVSAKIKSVSLKYRAIYRYACFFEWTPAVRATICACMYLL